MSDETSSEGRALDVWTKTRGDEGSFDVQLGEIDIGRPEPEWTATVRFDGCVHLHHHALDGQDKDDPDYLHVCYLDALIRHLERLRDAAREHFGADWPD